MAESIGPPGGSGWGIHLLRQELLAQSLGREDPCGSPAPAFLLENPTDRQSLAGCMGCRESDMTECLNRSRVASSRSQREEKTGAEENRG